jgi:hypothetical protein
MSHILDLTLVPWQCLLTYPTIYIFLVNRRLTRTGLKHLLDGAVCFTFVSKRRLMSGFHGLGDAKIDHWNQVVASNVLIIKFLISFSFHIFKYAIFITC